MNQFLQIMNEDTENSQFDVDIFLLFVFGEWWVTCFMIYCYTSFYFFIKIFIKIRAVFSSLYENHSFYCLIQIFYLEIFLGFSSHIFFRNILSLIVKFLSSCKCNFYFHKTAFKIDL